MYPRLDTKLGYLANGLVDSGRLVIYGMPSDPLGTVRSNSKIDLHILMKKNGWLPVFASAIAVFVGGFALWASLKLYKKIAPTKKKKLKNG